MDESECNAELIRCFDEDTVALTKDVLTEKGIPFRIDAVTPTSDFTAIGAGDAKKAMIMVPSSSLDAGRSALAEGVVKDDLPGDHFLHEAGVQGLVEIVVNPSEWSPFDVAHANRMIIERGIDVEQIQGAKEKHIAELEEGKPVPEALLFGGWVGCVFIGIFGLIVGCSIHSWKKTTDYGSFFVYDEKSRNAGRTLAICSAVVLSAWLALKIFVFFAR